ncbi:MAG: xylulokinase [Chloroflexota bacterium]
MIRRVGKVIVMPDESYVLAVDFGSTWCKAAYVNAAGKIIALGRSYVRGGPEFGHDERELRRAWHGFIGSVREATERLAEADPDSVPEAIAISVRKAPGIWLDADGHAIGVPRDAIDHAGRIDIDTCYSSDVWGDDDAFAYGYSIDLLGNTRWLRRVFPEHWRRVRLAGTLHNWFLLRLTGQWLTSHAAGPVQDDWPEAAAELTGLPLSAFPQVIADTAEVGELSSDLANELGLPAGTPVITGTHDGAAANIGAGAIRPGEACFTLGTNGVLRAVTGPRLPGQFGYTVTAERWALVRDSVGMALRLDEVVRALNDAGERVRAEHHEQLEAEALESTPQPWLLAEMLRTDTADLSKLVSRSLRSGHPPGQIYRTALEDATFRLLSLARIATKSGARIGRLVITGGATNNRLLLKLIASALERTLQVSSPEAGLIGAGILATVGAGWFDSVDEAVGAMVQYQPAVVPEPGLVPIYAELVRTLNLPAGFAPGSRDAESL